jgi:hypothetical protein
MSGHKTGVIMVLEYFGNENIISATKAYLKTYNQRGAKKALLLTGGAGIGKSHLTKYIAEKAGAELVSVNASQDRTKNKINDLIKTVRFGKRIIVVLDECEGMKDKDLEAIIRMSTVPLFLCCNFIDSVGYNVQNLCTILYFQQPPKYVFKQFIQSKAIECEVSLTEIEIDDLAKKAKSFRHAERLLFDPSDEEPEQIETKAQIIEKILRGEADSEHIDMQPNELLSWIGDNVHLPDIISSANVMLEHAYLDDYHHWMYVYSILGAVRSNTKVQFPRSIVLQSKVKKAHEVELEKELESQESFNDAKVDVNFSKVDTTAIKVGKSLFDGLDELNLNGSVEVKL